MPPKKKFKTKESSKMTIHRKHVDSLVFALQVKYPEKTWTSDSFAEEIGCTGAAVRKTKAWKDYQEWLLETQQGYSRQRKGYRDERGTPDGFSVDQQDDF